MRHLLLVGSFFLFTLTSYAQNGWAELGINGGYGLSFLLNQNISSDKHVSSVFSNGYMYGAKLAYNFNENHSLMFNVASTHLSQTYSIKPDTSKPLFEKTANMEKWDFALIYRHNSNGGYFEIGPQVSKLSKAWETNTINNVKTDISKALESIHYSGVLGFGANFINAGILTFTLGCRFNYAFSDLISDQGGKSQNSSYPLKDAFYSAKYQSYKPTNYLSAMLIAEMDFDLGYISRSKCGKRAIFTF